MQAFMASRLLPVLLLSTASLFAPGGAFAQSAPTPSLDVDTAGQDNTAGAAAAVHDFVQAEVARTQPQLRAEISVGPIDSRLRLAACARTEAFLRPGTRLWGRAFVGYRCLQRPGWSISVPVSVRLFGPALVALQPIAPMQSIEPYQVELREAEWTAEPGGVARELAALDGRQSTRAIDAGQAIPLAALRGLPAVNQGEPVKVVGTGSGFTITTEGTALANAAPGELVRVRMESGRTIAGTARKGRLVEVSF